MQNNKQQQPQQRQTKSQTQTLHIYKTKHIKHNSTQPKTHDTTQQQQQQHKTQLHTNNR